MKRTSFFSISALMLGAVLLLGGCQSSSSSYGYQFDGISNGYHTGYVITETPKPRPRAHRHYSTNYNVGYRTGYRSGGSFISIGHTAHYGHRSYHTGYGHGGYHGGYHHPHRSHYGHRGHSGGFIHFGGGHGGYYCD